MPNKFVIFEDEDPRSKSGPGWLIVPPVEDMATSVGESKSRKLGISITIMIAATVLLIGGVAVAFWPKS
jgi:hypothetical protein